MLDTDHISIIQQSAEPDFSAFLARKSRWASGDFSYSIVSFHEQVIGSHDYLIKGRNSRDTVKGYERLGRVLNTFAEGAILPFDMLAAETFGRLRAQRVKVGTMDLRIASIALSNELILLTRNTRDFDKIPGLVTENWTVS